MLKGSPERGVLVNIVEEFRKAQKRRGAIHELELAVFLEETFGLSLEEHHIRANNLTTDEIVDLVVSYSNR